MTALHYDSWPTPEDRRLKRGNGAWYAGELAAEAEANDIIDVGNRALVILSEILMN